MQDLYFTDLIKELSQLKEVEGILLSGSRAKEAYDENSDYDVYIYINKDIDVSTREIITKKYCSYMDLNNQYWETEDDGELLNGIDIELIYRNTNDIDRILESVVFKHHASLGYTTCFWANLLQSKVLYDKNGKLQNLINKYTVSYPKELKLNIINKNLPLLKEKPFSYYNQIKKAINRNDTVSINHRITEFLASYFDILFSINEIPHPGEKRLKHYVLSNCTLVPENFSNNLDQLIESISNNHQLILSCLDEMVNNLNKEIVR